MDERVSIEPIHCTGSCQSKLRQAQLCQTSRAEFILVLKPTSFGIRAPHWKTFHADCNCDIQNTKTSNSTTRVNRGSRKKYERNRAGLNEGSEGILRPGLF